MLELHSHLQSSSFSATLFAFFPFCILFIPFYLGHQTFDGLTPYAFNHQIKFVGIP